MWVDNDEYLVRCQCGSINHLFQLWICLEKEWNDGTLYFNFRNEYMPSFWKRLKSAIKYIFYGTRHKSKKEHPYLILHDEILVHLDGSIGREEIQGLINYLQKALDETKQLYEERLKNDKKTI